MADIKECLALLKEGINEELHNLKRLRGAALEDFTNVFGISEDSTIYFNSYNIVINDIDTYNQLQGYLKQGSLVLSLEIPEHNTYLWVHQYFNDRIFNDYLK